MSTRAHNLRLSDSYCDNVYQQWLILWCCSSTTSNAVLSTIPIVTSQPLYLVNMNRGDFWIFQPSMRAAIPHFFLRFNSWTCHTECNIFWDLRFTWHSMQPAWDMWTTKQMDCIFMLIRVQRWPNCYIIITSVTSACHSLVLPDYQLPHSIKNLAFQNQTYMVQQVWVCCVIKKNAEYILATASIAV